MKKAKVLLVVFVLISIMISFSSLTTPVKAVSWTAKWIWQSVDGPSDTWMCFRKTFSLSSIPATALADIAVDSKYWMWINGTMAVREGQLKRGPTPNDTYYDEVDIKNYLTTGSNTIAIMVDYWGVSGFSHRSSGKGGLLFQTDLGGTIIQSDNTWKLKIHPSYQVCSTQPNYRISERSVRFNAAADIPTWSNKTYDDSSWTAATEKGTPPCAPWNSLRLRPIPQWKDYGITTYTNNASLGLPKDGGNTNFICNLPYNCQVQAYLKVNTTTAGKVITIKSNTNAEQSLICEYLTKGGGVDEEYEVPIWINGDSINYYIPSGVTVKELKYRETGFNTAYAGSFNCSDSFYSTLWTKSKRTLNVCMRDNYFDCPDRERAQWWGDAVTEIGQTFYALDRNSDLLSQKAISNLFEWQRADKTMYAPVPEGNWSNELPVQILASIGTDGFWRYYFYSGDTATITNAYPHVRDYLSIWTLDVDGLVNHRPGGWDWTDWGSNIDGRVLDNCWYYWAVKAAKNMANLTGNTGDVAGYDAKLLSIQNNFNRVLWNNTQKYYYSPGYSGVVDDRANAMAVCVGLADSAKWPGIKAILTNSSYYNASPWMEKWVEESLFLMGEEQAALDRMKSRYTSMVNASSTTLYENFPASGTPNHSWAGGPLTLLSQYGVGVAPETAAFATYHVYPQLGNLTSASTVVPSVKGNISAAITRDASQYVIDLTSPSNTTAIIGLPKNAFGPYGNKTLNSITVGTTTIWSGGSYLGGVTGISWNGDDGRFVKFNTNPGAWSFKALPGTATSTPTPTPTMGPTATPTPTPTATPVMGTNLALNKTVNARVSLEGGDWGKAKMVDGTQTSITGSKGYTSDPPQSGQSYNEWVEIDLGANKTLNLVKLFPRTDVDTSGGETPNFPVDFTIQVKPDAGSYSTVKTITAQANPGHTPQSYDIGAQNARYVKIDVTKLGLPAYDESASNYYRLQLAEVEIYNTAATPVPTATPTPTPAATATPTPSSNRALNKTVISLSSLEGSGWFRTKVVDGQRNSVSGAMGWTSWNNNSANHTEWVKVDLGASYSINKVDLYPRNDSGKVGEGFPVDFTIQISTNDSTWTTVVTRTGYAKPSGTVQSFSFTAANARYVKVEGTNLRYNSAESIYVMQFAEIEVY
jgi:alpha-L-rhamnosidase